MNAPRQGILFHPGCRVLRPALPTCAAPSRSIVLERAMSDAFSRRATNYYHFYTERSANRLGGVPDYAGEYHYHMDGLIVTYWDKLVELKDKYFK